MTPLLLLSLGLSLTGLSTKSTFVWEALAQPHTSLCLLSEFGALLSIAVYAYAVNALITPSETHAPRCALGGADGTWLDALLALALALLLLPHAVARAAGTEEWQVPWAAHSDAAAMARVKEPREQRGVGSGEGGRERGGGGGGKGGGAQWGLTRREQKGAGGSEEGGWVEGGGGGKGDVPQWANDAGRVELGLDARAPREDLFSSLSSVKSGAPREDLFSSLASVKSLVATRVLGARAVAFEARLTPKNLTLTPRVNLRLTPNNLTLIPQRRPRGRIKG